MKKLQTFLLIGFLTHFSLPIFAVAPVVDDSENFATSDDAGNYNQNASIAEPDNLRPLAHDDNESSFFSKSTPQQVSVSQQGQVSAPINQEIQNLQQTIQELRGQLDHQNQVIETLKNQQLTLYKDLDARITAHPQTTTPAVPQEKLQIAESTKENISAMPPEPKATSSKDKVNPADEQISYMAAYEFINKKQYGQAEKALQDFIQQHPNSGYTPNAEYWLGELFLQEKNYATAIAHFENVVNNYPSSNKASSSLYKLGVALAANGQFEEAKNKYQLVTQKYPDTEASRLAVNQLKIL